LLEEISSNELTEWAAYDRIEPIGTHRADMQAASMCYWIAVVNSKKGARFKMSDFMLKFGTAGEESKPMSPRQIHQALCMRFGRPDKL
jgi:hypothetical protein